VLFEDSRFYQTWYNILVFVVLALLIGYLIPVILAIAINEMRHCKTYLRLGYYLPLIIPLVVVAIMWKYIYSPDEGLLDSLIQLLGFKPVGWLINGKTAMLSLVIMSTWKNAGGTMIIYLAALQGVPPQLYEAAEIDGATVWQRIRNITLPHMLPVMFILFILQIIGTAQLFVEPFIMTGGGPADKTYTPLMYIYNQAFSFMDYGVAVAMGLTLFIVLVTLTIIYFAIQRRLTRG
jgi:multiple sugar transport system permease protein